MKAAVIRQFGDPEVLRVEEIATPRPATGNVLVKVLAAGVNRFDTYIREGSVAPELPFPHVLGADAAGEIAAVGDEVSGLEVGQRVVPLTGYPVDPAENGTYPLSAASSFGVAGLSLPGTYAQYVEVPARWVLPEDTGLSAEEVATLPMVATTSVRAVKVVGGVRAGDRVLITAGASGVGSFQIQVAKALGAEVMATVRSESKIPAVYEIGADVVVDTRESDVATLAREWTEGRGIDVAVDNVGGEMLPRVLDALRGQGVAVAVGFVGGTRVTLDIRDFFFGQKELRGSLAGDVEDLRWALELVRCGKLKPLVDRALPLDAAAEAHRLVSENRVTGSVALLPWAA